MKKEDKKSSEVISEFLAFTRDIQAQFDYHFNAVNDYDKATGDLIARTGKVHSGEYVYVNVMDYYSEKGSHFVTVNIETMNEDNVPMNGLNQEMEIIVK